MSKELPMVLNLSDVETKRRLMSQIGTLKGLYEVTLKPRKKTRSLNQNSYYWAAYIPGYLSWLREEWGDPSITKDDAHYLLKAAVLGMRTRENKETGETLELPRDTHDMDTMEFAEYLEQAAAFLAQTCEIVVLPAEMFYEVKK